MLRMRRIRDPDWRRPINRAGVCFPHANGDAPAHHASEAGKAKKKQGLIGAERRGAEVASPIRAPFQHEAFRQLDDIDERILGMRST